MDQPEGLEGLASLIPQLGVEMATSGEQHKVIEGSMLSADISGFTALSERLAARGKAGAEDLTSLLNVCFTELIDAAYDYGGEVIKFGGDALLILFRGEDHMTRVAAAGLAMQAALAQSPAARGSKLTMTVGAAEGPFHGFMVGSLHHEVLICGANASHVIHLEGSADKGDTLVSEAIANALPESLRVRPQAGGWVISGKIDQRKTGPALRNIDRSQLSKLVPGAIEAQFEGFADLGGEHRIVAVAFLSVSGVDAHLIEHGPQSTGEELHKVTAAVQEACEEFGATPLHSDIAPGGSKFILSAGAPFTRGNTADAILEASLRIVKIESPFVLKIGVHQGRAFAGFLGSHYRRTYTLMGDAINTAARMLGKASNRDVVAVNDALDATRTLFATTEIEPFTVKGKTDPIHASYVFGTTDWTQRQRSAAPLMGRDAELKAVLEVLDGTGHAVQVVGPAGSGKSRLLDEVRIAASRQSITRVEAQCSPYSASTPYALLQIVLRRTADIEATSDPITAGELLFNSVLHSSPELLPMLPVLAIAAGAEVAPTDEASAIDPKFLRDRIHEVAATFLLGSLPGTSLFILEDMQWVDDASAEFLDFVLHQQSGALWTVLISCREGGNWRVDDQDEQRSTIRLEPLLSPDVHKLALAVATTDLPDSVVARIVRQAAGNPLFAIELTRAIESSPDGAIPDTVEELVASRVDSLGPGLRTTLRVASVFGNKLAKADLAAVLERPVPDLSALGEFVAEARDGSLLFTNALFQEVAYEGLPYSQRKQLHLRVGTHLESSTKDRVPISGLLASHFFEAGESRKTWTYGVIAGDDAVAHAANVEAANSYRRAVKASERLKDLGGMEISRIAMALGDVEGTLGRFEDSELAYQRAKKSSDNDATAAMAMLRIGSLREKQGKTPLARSWYTRAEHLLRDSGENDVEVLRVKSQLHFLRSGLGYRTNDFQTCIVEGRKALGHAEDADDVEAMAEALQRLHLSTTYLRRPDRIGYGPRALELFTELNRQERRSIVLNNLGIEKYFAGEWAAAAQFYQESSEAGLLAGSMIGGMLGALNSGEILSDQGHWDEAIVQLEAARRNWDGGRYPVGAAVARLFLGAAHDRRGDRPSAVEFFNEAVAKAAELGMVEHEDEARYRLLFSDVCAGEASITQVDALAEAFGADHALSSSVRRTRAVAIAMGGNWKSERGVLVELLEAAVDYDRLLTLRMLKHYDGDKANDAWGQEIQDISSRLGVIKLRQLPPGS